MAARGHRIGDRRACRDRGDEGRLGRDHAVALIGLERGLEFVDVLAAAKRERATGQGEQGEAAGDRQGILIRRGLGDRRGRRRGDSLDRQRRGKRRGFDRRDIGRGGRSGLGHAHQGRARGRARRGGARRSGAGRGAARRGRGPCRRRRGSAAVVVVVVVVEGVATVGAGVVVCITGAGVGAGALVVTGDGGAITTGAGSAVCASKGVADKARTAAIAVMPGRIMCGCVGHAVTNRPAPESGP